MKILLKSFVLMWLLLFINARPGLASLSYPIFEQDANIIKFTQTLLLKQQERQGRYNSRTPFPKVMETARLRGRRSFIKRKNFVRGRRKNFVHKERGSLRSKLQDKFHERRRNARNRRR